MTTPAYGEPQGNVFTRKIGPLPLWGWAGIAALGVFAFSLYRKNKASNQVNASNNVPAGETDSSLVPQFVNQTFVNEVPPAAPSQSHVNVTLSGNPSQPVVTQGEGTSGTKIQGLSITPYKNGTVHVGFGGIPGAKKYTVQVINAKTHKYVYNQQVATTHPTLHLPAGEYIMHVSGVGYTGTVSKNFTVP